MTSRSSTRRAARTRPTSQAGVHWTGAWFDFADGNRPGPALDLHVISDTAADDDWARWPGSWGGTEPPSGDINPLDDASPRGPGRHAQYTAPDVLLDTAAAHAADVKRTPPPAAAAPRPHGHDDRRGQ